MSNRYFCRFTDSRRNYSRRHGSDNGLNGLGGETGVLMVLVSMSSASGILVRVQMGELCCRLS